jgi:hypothetical protein
LQNSIFVNCLKVKNKLNEDNNIDMIAYSTLLASG